MKRVLSLLLALVIVAAVIPTWEVQAAEIPEFQFMKEVTYELPIVELGKLINEGTTLPEPRADGFILEPSAPLPEIRADGFLAELSAPLPEFPARGGLMEAPGDPDPDAISISNAEELKQIAGGGNFVLTQDIDLSGSNWDGIKVSKNLTLD